MLKKMMEMEKEEVLELLKDIQHKEVRIYANTGTDRASVYTLSRLVHSNTTTITFFDKYVTEITLPYSSISKITRRDRYGKRYDHE